MKRRNHWLALHRAALRGKLARRFGLELHHVPYRGRGFARQLAEAWADGWREEDRDRKAEERYKKYFENLPSPG